MSIKTIWHKVKAIPFIGTTYEKYIGTKKVARIEKKWREDLINNGNNYIKLVEQTLQDSGAIYFADAGTLLGFVRDGKFLSWDLDIDYGIVISDSFTWNDLECVMNKSGFKKSREFTYEGMVKEQSYSKGKLNIDFFGHFYEGDRMIQYSFEYRQDCVYSDEDERSVYLITLPKVEKTKKLQIGDVSVSVPENSEDLLAALYNDDWRIPNPNWKSNSGNNTVLLSGKRAKCVLY